MAFNIKIKTRDIPSLNLPDNVYNTYCEYLNGPLKDYYKSHKYFSNQSLSFHVILRGINEDLKNSNVDYVD
ncbi:24604_t:CDS:1, partial [Gigaspora margarita]